MTDVTVAEPTALEDVDRPRLPRGWAVVARKEMADLFLSVRFSLLLVLLALVAAGGIYAAAGGISSVASEVGEVPQLFLRVFTAPPARYVPRLYELIALLAPLLGIAFGFDAVNSERAQGTLPRLLAQPLYRDDVVNGKFVAAISVIATVIVSLVILVSGIAMLRLGVLPGAEEVIRIVTWTLLTLLYLGFWLALAMLCSVIFRSAAASALLAIFAWLFLVLLFPYITGIVASAVSPPGTNAADPATVANASFEYTISHASPSTLYSEATLYLLTPELNTQSPIITGAQFAESQFQVSSQLSVGQSLILAVPQILGLVALTLVCFIAAYILFMRQEVRA